MQQQYVTLSVPPEAGYARSVRMLAASLGVLCTLSVDDIEDLRMAAEEGFVYACATMPEMCEISFSLDDGAVEIGFGLGDADADEDERLFYANLILSTICDEFEVDHESRQLRVVKRMGTGDNAER